MNEISQRIHDALQDTVYQRERLDDVTEALDRLSCKPTGKFRRFYEQYAGPSSSSAIGLELLDIADQEPNIQTQTLDARREFGFPDRYLVISNLVANAVLVYDCESDAVHSVDFEGSDTELLAGDLTPRWTSFEEFLLDFFG